MQNFGVPEGNTLFCACRNCLSLAGPKESRRGLKMWERRLPLPLDILALLSVYKGERYPVGQV